MSYAIPDEPQRSKWNHLVFRPSAPLLATMLCGAWLAWPWFAFNSFAMGSPTRRREIQLCVIGFAGTVVLAFATLALLDRGVLADTSLKLCMLAISTWKLALSYRISLVQGRTFEIYRYYGGAVRPATYVLVAGYYLRTLVLGIDDPFWIIVLLGGL